MFDWGAVRPPNRARDYVVRFAPGAKRGAVERPAVRSDQKRCAGSEIDRSPNFSEAFPRRRPIANRLRRPPRGGTSSLRSRGFLFERTAEFPARFARSVLTLFMS